jgi:hypothetical protein
MEYVPNDVIGRTSEHGCAGLVMGGEAGIGKTTVWQAARPHFAVKAIQLS